METIDLLVTKAAPNLGARVEGLDLSTVDLESAVSQLRPILLEHHVLVIPGVVLPPDRLEAFARCWGELLEHPATRVPETPFVQLIASSGNRRLGNWHSDMTWHETPPCITMLHAHELPGEGGDTIFANQHVAYETLPEHLRSQLDGARANNSGKVFGPNFPDTVHPAVRTHDETGRKALYVNRAFTTRIEGMEESASRVLLLEAILHATRPEFTYRHTWAVGDLVLWDNRSVMHCPVVDYSEQRTMHRAVVAGGRPQ